MSAKRKPGTSKAEFRKDSRSRRKAAAEREVPESRTGAEPADADSPEFSRGQALDDPQPSTRQQPQPKPDEDDRERRELRTRVAGQRAHIESLLEGVPLPATRDDLVNYAQRNGDPKATEALKSLPAGRYDWLDQVGEALEPVQPKWSPERRVPKAESGLPPGGPAYGIDRAG